MKTVMCFALVVLHAVAVAHGSEPYFDFARSGDTVDIEKKVRRKTERHKEVKVPINSVLDDASFECSFRTTFPGWRYYGEVSAGVAGLKANFSMGDSGKRTVSLPVGSYVFPKGKAFIIVLRYCAFTRSISAVVKDKDGKELHKTRWKKTFRKSPVREFRVTAKSPHKETDTIKSSITVDKKTGTLYARSRTGKSYFISADISDVAIKVMPDGFEDRLNGTK